MGGVLETYEKLIGQMLQQLPAHPTPQAAESNELPAGGDVRAELSYVLKKVQELRKHRYREQEALLQELRALRHLQVERHPLTLSPRERESPEEGLCRAYKGHKVEIIRGLCRAY